MASELVCEFNLIYKFACLSVRLSDLTVLHFNSSAEPVELAFSMAEPVDFATPLCVRSSVRLSICPFVYPSVRLSGVFFSPSLKLSIRLSLKIRDRSSLLKNKRSA